MLPRRSAFAILALILTTQFKGTVADLSFPANSCADPSAFTQCWNAATNEGTSCFNKNCQSGDCTDIDNCSSPDENCAASCTCVAYEAWINCALSTCWNLVYTCEYLDLLVQATRNCPIANTGISSGWPYFPASADGSTPNSCSCDLFYVYSKTRTASAYLPSCENSFSSQDCNCCADTEVASSFYNMCPNTDPSAVNFFSELIEPSVESLSSSTCENVLSSNINCLNLDFSVPGVSGAQFLTADTVPANGTDGLSNSDGEITSPPGGATLTWTFAANQVYTATAVIGGGSVATSAGGSSGAGSTSSSAAVATGVSNWSLGLVVAAAVVGLGL